MMTREITSLRVHNDLRAVLNEFLSVKGVIVAAVVGRDGFVIDSAGSGDIDMEALGAMVATAIGTSESLGQEFELGAMESYLAEFAGGKILMAAVRDDILAVVTDPAAVIGGVRYSVRKNIANLLKVL